MKKQTGIWMDFKEANIIELEGGKNRTSTILSGIEDFHITGGARSKTPWGPMDKTSESKYLERRLHQSQRYYQNILEALSESEELFLFGPAEAKIGLRDYLKNQRNLKIKLRAVKTADAMTINQKIAMVKAFFTPKLKIN